MLSVLCPGRGCGWLGGFLPSGADPPWGPMAACWDFWKEPRWKPGGGGSVAEHDCTWRADTLLGAEVLLRQGETLPGPLWPLHLRALAAPGGLRAAASVLASTSPSAVHSPPGSPRGFLKSILPELHVALGERFVRKWTGRRQQVPAGSVPQACRPQAAGDQFPFPS